MSYNDHIFWFDLVVGIVGYVGWLYWLAGGCGSCFDSGISYPDAWGGVVLYVENLVDRERFAMKCVRGLITIGLICLFACTPKSETTLLTLDLKGDYPKKEVFLQDFWEVEYVPLETDSIFLVASNRPWYVGEEYVGFMDNRTGNMLFFDIATGKKSYCVNRKGSGPEEYRGVGALSMDEEKKEVFAWGHWDGVIMVYDVQGNFLRKFPLGRKGEMVMIAGMVDVNQKYFACSAYESISGRYSLCYYLDKQTGERVLLDSIPTERFVSPIIMKEMDGVMRAVEANLSPIVKSVEGFVYADYSNDTIYRVSSDGCMKPMLVRSPFIKETDPKILLKYGSEANGWMFLSSVELDYDFVQEKGLRQKYYGIQKQDGQVYELKYVNKDYPEGEFNVSGANVFYLSVDKLMEALEAGKLHGQLKNVASQLCGDDNGVIMRLRSKVE